MGLKKREQTGAIVKTGRVSKKEADNVSFGLVYRGQYSDAVLSELENQNDQHLEGISAKVKMLKDVRSRFPIPISNRSPQTHSLT